MDNCSSLEPWAFWISEAFAHENEAITKALQISLSSGSSSAAAAANSSSSSSSSFLHDLAKPEPAAVSSASDPDLVSIRARNAIPCSKSEKILKRKSRASKRCPTTYINVDPAEFRAMVQQVTGVRFGEADLPVEPVIKPVAEMVGGNRLVLQQSFLPTLDTSAFALDRAGPVGGSDGSFGPVVDGPEFDFESLLSFPNLESWGCDVKISNIEGDFPSFF